MQQEQEESRTIDQFRIVREIGRGGMGVVYEAVDELSGRHVALKVLPLAAADADIRFRFEREIRTTAGLSHPNLIRVYSVGSVNDQPYYTMEYVDGASLEDFIRLPWLMLPYLLGRASLPEGTPLPGTRPSYEDPTTAGESGEDPGADRGLAPTRLRGVPQVTQRLPEAELAKPSTAVLPRASLWLQDREYYRFVARVVRDAAQGLAHAHQHGVVHRDIKPANILLTRAGEVRVTDFGIAIEMDMDRVTRTGAIVGTPRYMSPEQLLKSQVRVDARSDVYSLGATLYELLTLRPAFDADNREQLLLKIAVQEPSRPRQINLYLPKELETIALKALEKDPDRRYQAAADLAADLARYLNGEAILAAPPSPLVQLLRLTRRHPALSAAALASVVVLGACLVGGWQLHQVHLRVRVAALKGQAEEAVRRHQAGDAVARIQQALVLAPTDRSLQDLLGDYRVAAARAEEQAERRKREEEAGRQCAEAQGHVERYQAALKVLRDGQPRLDQILRDLNGVTPCGPDPDKAVIESDMATVEEGMAAARREATLTFDQASGHLHQALYLVPDLAAARTLLARLYDAALTAAEAEGNAAEVAVFEKLVQLYDRDGSGTGLPGRTGRLQVETDPPGALVTVFRYESDGSRLVPKRESALGVSPTQAAALGSGSLRLLIERDGYHRVTYLLRLGREESVTVRVPLLTEEEVGVGMVYIPAGRFVQGGDRLSEWPLPAGVVHLPGFLIAEHEVTCGEYLEFLNDLAHTAAEQADRCRPSIAPNGEAVPWPRKPDGRYAAYGFQTHQHPVEGISPQAADAYCEWLSARTGRRYRLPTAAEWEKAARGADGRIFPWGDRPQPRSANYVFWSYQSAAEGVGPAPVGSYPEDLSPFGLYDTAGNVLEVCADLRDRIGNRAVKGGAWYCPHEFCRLPARYRKAVSTPYRGLGFRVAADLPGRLRQEVPPAGQK